MMSSCSRFATSCCFTASASAYGDDCSNKGYSSCVTSWKLTRSAKPRSRNGLAYEMKWTSWPRRASSRPSSVATAPEPPFEDTLGDQRGGVRGVDRPDLRVPELIAKPGILPLRVLPRRREDRIAQQGLRQAALQHRDHLSVSDSVEPGRIGRNPRIERPADFVDQPGREHLIHAQREPSMQDAARHREVNVPRPKHAARARLALPPRQRAAGQQRDLDGARGALAPTARKAGTERAAPET